MNIGISADSTCDIPQDLIQKYDINITHLTVLLGDEEHKDGVDITPTQIFDFVDKTGILPKTSAINTTEYTEHFTKLTKKYDAVIHFSLSFNISSTGNNARLASQKFDNVYVIDTKSLSSGSGLLILSCVDKINAGKDLKTILNELEKEVNKIQASFLVDTLKFLHKGGRCSSIALLGANLLKIKPRISLVDGEMQVTKKYRGNIQDALLKYADDLLEEIKPDKTRVFVTYSSRVNPTVDILKDKLRSLGFKQIIESQAGATICSHCGKKTLGVLYMSE